MTKLVLVSKKIEIEDKRKCDNSYASSKAEIIINESHIDDVFQPIHTIIITGIQISLGKVQAGLLTQYISISKYNPLAASSYIKLPKELDHSRKGLINIQNTHDNECFKWCFVRYLNSSDHIPRRITKNDKDFARRFNFKDIKFPVNITDIHKIKKRIPLALAFLVMKISRHIQSMYQKKNM